jgi:hypothetical protein
MTGEYTPEDEARDDAEIAARLVRDGLLTVAAAWRPPSPPA